MPSWTGASYTRNMSRKHRALYCRCLLLAMWMALCSGTNNETALATLLNNVYSVIENKSVLPFCFTSTLFDLMCFWESNTSDASSYVFHSDVGYCNLTTVAASNGTWWHVYQFPENYVDLFSVTPYHITVMDRRDNSSFSRNVLTAEVVYLEPIEIIAIKEQLSPLGLWILLKEINMELMSRSVMYEVRYANEENDVQKNETFQNADAHEAQKHGYVKLFLPDIVRGAEYTLSVRVKAGGEYDGYWSQWTDAHVQTSNIVDILHVTLFVIAGLIPIVVIILLTTCQRRFLKKKVWPKIPSPEHHFKELYSTHKGNFKLWLDQTDSYLLWISRNIFHEGPISTLEVLSELPNAVPPPPPPVQLRPKDTYVTLDESFLPHFPAWMVTERQIDTQMELLSPAEAPSQKMPRSEGRPEEDVRETTTEEVPSVEESREKPGGLTIQREDSLTSEEGKQSAGSSFEYTVLETCDGLLSPRTRSIRPRQPLKYAYLLMSESGEESPPPSPNIYQNSICAQLPAHIYSQC